MLTRSFQSGWGASNEIDVVTREGHAEIAEIAEV